MAPSVYLDGLLNSRYTVSYLGAAAIFSAGAIVWFRRVRDQTRKPSLRYVEYESRKVVTHGASKTLVVDCLHPTCVNLTHHKGSNTPDSVKGDSSGAWNILRPRRIPLQVSVA
ncbi:hypothetical protein CYMTET_56292 [Cymbomonas tetramitiformis]|uniref:Uncharacterized protein n=1 Tax=Cymbomonas tetramitiformis TaxID=36881 RepID=A0AAE0BCH5_9CHLO|nr:hypothetical protein CYMTET_56292 [Cymbomonas tetramitiformis]